MIEQGTIVKIPTFWVLLADDIRHRSAKVSGEEGYVDAMASRKVPS
jgi:hypothetical protein